jgi:hypothetical protein
MSDYTPPIKTEFITDAERTDGAKEIMQIIDQVCLVHLLLSRTVYDVTTAMSNTIPIDLLRERPRPSFSNLSFVHCVQVLGCTDCSAISYRQDPEIAPREGCLNEHSVTDSLRDGDARDVEG